TQETGDSKDDVMSQDAATKAFAHLGSDNTFKGDNAFEGEVSVDDLDVSGETNFDNIPKIDGQPIVGYQPEMEGGRRTVGSTKTLELGGIVSTLGLEEGDVIR